MHHDKPHCARRPALHPELRQLFAGILGADLDGSQVATSQWAPRVDIQEEENQFVIRADIPGVDPKEIEIHMDKGLLTIRGERTIDKQEGVRFTRNERHQGTFYRRFALPDTANPEGIAATGKHGVLEILIPKRPESTPRRITVS